MLECQLELEGGLTVCRLGALRPEGGQALECLLRLEGVQPGRRVAVSAEALEGEEVIASRVFSVPPADGPGPGDVPVVLRLYFEGDGPRTITLRADAHYADQSGRCVL